MYVKPSDSKKTVDSNCGCTGAITGAIVLDNECIVAMIEGDCEDDKVCLGDLSIPITSSFKQRKIVKPGETYKLDADCNTYKFLAVYIDDNKNCLWREIDEVFDNNFTLNYKLDLQITTGDLRESIVDLSAVFTFVPDYKSIIAKWNNTDINHRLPDGTIVPARWRDFTNTTWLQASPGNMSNTLILPTVTGTLADKLFLNEAETELNGTITGRVVTGAVAFLVSVSVKYVVLTDTLTHTLDSITLDSEFRGGMDTFVNTTITSGTSGNFNQVVAHEGSIGKSYYTRTRVSKRWKDLAAWLVLSSTSGLKLDSVEFYNTGLTDIKLNILGAF